MFFRDKPPINKSGRGAHSNHSGRYEQLSHHAERNDSHQEAEEHQKRTTVIRENAKRIISYNQSPDVPFDRSINPYQGCEHGCIYCFARPSHAYYGLSAGLDFESKLFAKTNAAQLLREELSHKNYRPSTIALGANTDAYQPIEKKLGITREILEVLCEARHPVAIVTKSALVERDIDILSQMANNGLVRVIVSLTSLDSSFSRACEPRASSPKRRLQCIAALHNAGITTGILLAPLIPALNCNEIENILEQAYNAGARQASYVLLRLPLEVKELFVEWLRTYYPQRSDRVIQQIVDTRGGKMYDTSFGARMRGEGPIAEMLAQRFQLQCKKLELNSDAQPLCEALFVQPEKNGQLSLF